MEKVFRYILGILAIIILMISTALTLLFTVALILSLLVSFSSIPYMIVCNTMDFITFGLFVTPILLIVFKNTQKDDNEIIIPMESLLGFMICCFRFLAITTWNESLKISAIVAAIYFSLSIISFVKLSKKIESD